MVANVCTKNKDKPDPVVGSKITKVNPEVSINNNYLIINLII